MNNNDLEFFKSKRNNLIKVKDFVGARALENKYIEKYPDNADLYHMAAWTAEALGDFNVAEHLLKYAFMLNPSKYVRNLVRLFYKNYDTKVAYSKSIEYIDGKHEDLVNAVFCRRLNGWRPDGYSTHQPLLLSLVCATDGPILELGGGWYSSPILKSIAQIEKRRVYTVETSKFVYHALQALDSEYYSIKLMEGFDFSDLGKFQNIENKSKKYYLGLQEEFLNGMVESARVSKWSVVFIDHSPGFLRAPAIKLLANIADYVVTHDTEALQHYSLPDAFKEFKYISHSKWFKPYTTVMSNYMDLSNIAPLINFSAEKILEVILLEIQCI